MICPKCGGEVQVVDSRHNAETVVRRRRCKICKHIFYTQETITDSAVFSDIAYPFYRAGRKKK